MIQLTRRRCCPKCRSDNLSLAFPAWAKERADGSLDFIQLDDDSDPLYWICDDCEETGNGEPALRGAP